MTPEALDDLLRLWGRIYGEPKPAEWDEQDIGSTHVTNPIQRGMEFAPGSRVEFVRQRTSMDRGGQSRRRMMAQAAGVERLRMVPASLVDPVRCVATPSGSASAWREIPEVEAVQAAWKALWKADELQANVVRVEYQVRAMTQREKAVEVGTTFGNYRLMLAIGRGFILGKLSP